jgi:hypothetical protein
MTTEEITGSDYNVANMTNQFGLKRITSDIGNKTNYLKK